MVDIIIL